ncbi:uncharacterized protein LOC134251402 [Saccostrea cucullata]|uniref:uncharacterized protein LOC134251402 n=1 Tax=Saccostrea cuccullata TaxID=36930 RepID=UPI002ED022A3
MLQDMDVCKNMIVKLLRELQEFHSTAPNTCASIYESNTQSLMDCLIIHMPNRIECRFYSILDDGMKFTIAVPPVAYSLVPDLICYENNVDLFVDRLPTANTKLSSGIYEIKQSKPYGLEVLYCLELPIRGCKEHQSILCSFDNGQNWSILTLEKVR